MARMAALYDWDGTDPGLKRLKYRGADGRLSDGGSRGAGRLVVKVSAPKDDEDRKPHLTFYFSYFHDGRQRFLPVGEYPDVALKDARRQAGDYSRLYQSGVTDLHGHFAAELAAKAKAAKDAQEALQRAEGRARTHTLRELLDAYSAYLRRQERQSAGDVESIFKLHVFDAYPELSARRASDIGVDDFVPVLAKLIDKRKGRTAAKLRSYLRAAYALAIRSKTDPDAPLILRAFDIHANPIASIDAKALSKYSRARTRNLSADELRHFLLRLEEVPTSSKKGALLLALQLGGQRPIQLLRTRPEDCDLPAATLTIYDAKGARQEPRAHVLPLSAKSAAIVKRCLASREECPTIFTTDGKRPLRSETVSAIVTAISAAMVKAKEARQGFELRDIRRTCETMMAALGVSKDLRAQLQSHGLSGVQSRHYDRYEYMLEKRAALAKWETQLQRIRSGKTADVRPMRQRKAV